MNIGALIVETRLLPKLVGLIRMHLNAIPHFHTNSQLHVYGSKENEKILKKEFPGLNFKCIPKETVVDSAYYNGLLTKLSTWWDLVSYSRVLVFQHDSEILAPGLEYFMPYDYVGAPWKFQHHGGNGGLSFRNPKVMYEICEKFKWDGSNEDVWFTNIMYNKAIGNLAPREINEEFSCEAIFRLGTFGAHAIDRWLTPNQCNQIREYQSKRREKENKPTFGSPNMFKEL